MKSPRRQMIARVTNEETEGRDSMRLHIVEITSSMMKYPTGQRQKEHAVPMADPGGVKLNQQTASNTATPVVIRYLVDCCPAQLYMKVHIKSHIKIKERNCNCKMTKFGKIPRNLNHSIKSPNSGFYTHQIYPPLGPFIKVRSY